jgi:hypothetical protein
LLKVSLKSNIFKYFTQSLIVQDRHKFKQNNLNNKTSLTQLFKTKTNKPQTSLHRKARPIPIFSILKKEVYTYKNKLKITYESRGSIEDLE